ncbi:D-glycerate dehydrogenase, partial [Candidatus Pacearchaeota archaeon]|nr:D-glycerate dehydrogenase [Candidatus Pacearchaeota archaeon]
MTAQARVLLTHKIPETGLNLLRDEMEVLILDDKSPIDSQLQKMLSSVDYLVPLLSVDITKDLMELTSSIKGIANYAVGYNNIDIEAAKKRNILVTNTPDVLT